MKDADKGIKELNLEKDKKIFNHCFTGKRLCKSEAGQLGKQHEVPSEPYVWGGACGARWVGEVIGRRLANMRTELPQSGNRMKGRKELCCPRNSFGNSNYISQRSFFHPVIGIMLK